jgi:8-oxo-dGTP diphosphatase
MSQNDWLLAPRCPRPLLAGSHRCVTIAPMSGNQSSGIHHVVAGLLVDVDKVLLCRRSPSRRWYPSVWDLPGGHVEENEAPPVALVRELHEELGIVVAEPAGPAYAYLQRPDFDCRIWVFREWIGIPHIASDEHDDLGWWSPKATADLKLAVESYRPMLQRAVSGVDG